MDLGLKIKQLRQKHGFTQESLASLLEISSQSISKWETGLTLPDISLLPKLSEIFGITIDELFDLSIDQKLSRIENKLDLTEELKYNEFSEIESYLKVLLVSKDYKNKALYTLSYLYSHRLMADQKRIKKYASEAIKLEPSIKECQWMLGKAIRDNCWDWDMTNHNSSIEFYKEVVNENKDVSLPYFYLIDNLIADHRADEAELYLKELIRLRPEKIVMIESYKAGIALARYNEKEADEIMANLEKNHIDEDGCYFEIAQYYAKKGEFLKAIPYYEKSFETTKRRPRFIDELLSIETIYEILGDYKKQLETVDRIIECNKTEWNMTEEVELKDMEMKRLALLDKIK